VTTEVEQFWEDHYGAAERVWSGRANATLVDVVQDLPPARRSTSAAARAATPSGWPCAAGR
jgi:hypothetical protein